MEEYKNSYEQIPMRKGRKSKKRNTFTKKARFN